MDLAWLPELWPVSQPVETRTLGGGINNLTLWVETQAGSYVLRIHRNHTDPARIGYEIDVMRQVRDAGLPFAVPVPIPARSGELVVAVPDPEAADNFGTGASVRGGPEGAPVRQALATLTPAIPGGRSDCRAPLHSFLGGQALGELITAMSGIRPPVEGMAPTYGEWDRVHPAFADPAAGLQRLPAGPESREKAARLMRRVLEETPAAYAALPRQMIHGDFVGFNLLFDGDRVSGILDFEFTGHDLRALDFATGLLSWSEPDDWGTGREWWPMEAFARGCFSRIRLTSAELEALPFLIRLRRAATVCHMGGRYLAGSASESLARWAVDSAAHWEEWLTSYERELISRSLFWP